MEKQTSLNEILIRFGASSIPSAAHVVRVERVVDSDGSVIAERSLQAEPIDETTLAAVSQALQPLIANLQMIGAQPLQPSDDPVDNPLKRWQFQAMVDYLGVGDEIEAAINAMTDPMQKAVAMARYKDSDIYRRDDPLIGQLAPVVGLTDQQIDDAWMQIASGV